MSKGPENMTLEEKSSCDSRLRVRCSESGGKLNWLGGKLSPTQEAQTGASWSNLVYNVILFIETPFNMFTWTLHCKHPAA